MKKIYLLLSLMCIIFVQVANAQNRQISGVVTSADDGSTIPGVSVMVKGKPDDRRGLLNKRSPLLADVRSCCR